MTYIFGCSMAKWYWPTWADWLQVYSQPVTNFSYPGYGNSNSYWNLLAYSDKLTPSDHVIISWTQNHRLTQWYDNTWIKENDCLGFFPDTNGQLWFTGDKPYMGLYRTHPDRQSSYTNMLIDQLQNMLHTQLLLEKIGCKYTMVTMNNLWWDGRPIYKPTFKTMWQTKTGASRDDIKIANDVIKLLPIRNLLKQINWSAYANGPSDPFKPEQYTGIWEYYVNTREYTKLKHEVDNHPNALIHHDFALEVLLKQDPKTGKHRDVARQIAEDAMTMYIPEFSPMDFVASPETQLLDKKYKTMLEELN